MDLELSFRVACAFGIVSSWLSIMLTLMICLPYCLSRYDRVRTREAHFAMSTPSVNPTSEIVDELFCEKIGEIVDELLCEEELGANPVVMRDDSVTH